MNQNPDAHVVYIYTVYIYYLFFNNYFKKGDGSTDFIFLGIKIRLQCFVNVHL